MKSINTKPVFSETDDCFSLNISSRYGITPLIRRKMLRKLETLIPRLTDYQVLKGKIAEFTENEVLQLCRLVNDTFMDSGIYLEIDLNTPLYVLGDLFAQYSDLLRIFILLGWPPTARYLFLGNYVNRGDRSVETIALLFGLKVRFPHHIFLLRGCHESEEVSRHYGLLEECTKRFDTTLWRELCTSFNHMPVAALVEEKIFCVNSGLSPTIHNSKITDKEELKAFLGKNICRPVEVEKNVIMKHFLWSDPDTEAELWDQNPNGVGYLFGSKVVSEFCDRFDFDMIIRSNEMLMNGYAAMPTEPRLVTVFTAPNYNGAFKNNGGILELRRCAWDGEIRTRLLLVKPILKLRGKITGRMNIAIEPSSMQAVTEVLSSDEDEEH